MENKETLEDEFKFKNRQMGAARFVGNKIMENMISKFKQETQEEPKQEFPIINGSYGCTIQTKKEESTQEKPEEAAEDYVWEHKRFSETDKAFIAGAKWQTERMYSEEEVEQIARFGFNAGRRVELKAVDLDFTFEKWFEQFKKK